MIFTIPNLLSFMRAPLAFCFLVDHPMVRLLAIILAGITDVLDGYLARRYRLSSQFGAMLDPLMDRFFVFFAVAIFLSEKLLLPWHFLALFARDFAELLYGLYLLIKKRFKNYQVKALWMGKLTTFLQFILLIFLTLGYSVDPIYFYGFIALGGMTFLELLFFG